jgi:hypothetical protein
VSDTETRQALAFLKSLVDSFDASTWEPGAGASATYTESFRTVTVWCEGSDVIARVTTGAGVEASVAASDYPLVRTLAEAVGLESSPSEE